MFGFLNEKKLTPASGKVFQFDNIKEAVMAQESGSINGKIVVEVMDRYKEEV
jgi:NADPH:quinone reductase-like Zn-dependent oxidoreductase